MCCGLDFFTANLFDSPQFAIFTENQTRIPGLSQHIIVMILQRCRCSTVHPGWTVQHDWRLVEEYQRFATSMEGPDFHNSSTLPRFFRTPMDVQNSQELSETHVTNKDKLKIYYHLSSSIYVHLWLSWVFLWVRFQKGQWCFILPPPQGDRTACWLEFSHTV